MIKIQANEKIILLEKKNTLKDLKKVLKKRININEPDQLYYLDDTNDKIYLESDEDLLISYNFKKTQKIFLEIEKENETEKYLSFFKDFKEYIFNIFPELFQNLKKHFSFDTIYCKNCFFNFLNLKKKKKDNCEMCKNKEYITISEQMKILLNFLNEQKKDNENNLSSIIQNYSIIKFNSETKFDMSIDFLIKKKFSLTDNLSNGKTINNIVNQFEKEENEKNFENKDNFLLNEFSLGRKFTNYENHKNIKNEDNFRLNEFSLGKKFENYPNSKIDKNFQNEDNFQIKKQFEIKRNLDFKDHSKINKIKKNFKIGEIRNCLKINDNLIDSQISSKFQIKDFCSDSEMNQNSKKSQKSEKLKKIKKSLNSKYENFQDSKISENLKNSSQITNKINSNKKNQKKNKKYLLEDLKIQINPKKQKKIPNKINNKLLEDFTKISDITEKKISFQKENDSFLDFSSKMQNAKNKRFSVPILKKKKTKKNFDLKFKIIEKECKILENGEIEIKFIFCNLNKFDWPLNFGIRSDKENCKFCDYEFRFKKIVKSLEIQDIKFTLKKNKEDCSELFFYFFTEDGEKDFISENFKFCLKEKINDSFFSLCSFI